MKSRVVFIGGVWLPEEEKTIISKSKNMIQNAANMLQSSFIRGFDYHFQNAVNIISAIFVGSYPKLYNDLIIKGKEFNHTSINEHKDYQVSFVNFPLLKHYSREFHCRKYIRKLCRQTRNEKIYVIGYSMTHYVVKGLLYAKKVNPKITTCLIVPDLPQYMNLGKKSKIVRLLKRKETASLYNDIQKIDSFVLLTEHMYSMLQTVKPYVVVEGIANTIKTTLEENSGYSEKKYKNIVYTGTLGAKYGICELVDAFCELPNEEFRLVICGTGDAEEYIREKMKKDIRIQYLGSVDHETAKKLQREAYFLVNPRNSNEEYTKYSFPSKTMEYMLSGRPVLMYKLLGIPSEYNDYLYYVEDNLEKSLKKIAQIPSCELESKGKKAKEFVLTQKNEINQTAKVMHMLMDI